MFGIYANFSSRIDSKKEEEEEKIPEIDDEH